MEPRRLYRSTEDRKIGGVAAGIAAYFELDPLLIRLLFVILTLAGGGGIIIYIILWIVTPEQPHGYTGSRSQVNDSPPPPPENEPGTYAGADSAEFHHTYTPPETGNAPVDIKNRQRGSLIGGLVLITIGGLFLADELLPDFNFWDFWPVILIVVGGGLLIRGFNKGSGK